MSSYDALEAFSGAIIGEAEKEKEALMQELEKKSEEKIKAKEKELSAKQESAVGMEMGRLVMQKGVELSKIKNEGRKKLIAKRTEIFNKVFDEVTENVRKYTETDAYKEAVKADFEAVKGEIQGSAFKVYVLPKDLELIPGAEETKEDIVGGFIAEAPEKGLYFDCTLRAKIRGQQDYFYKNSGLVID
jgi:vacuolar-type H+-ATPase subunit E/Vma4